MDLQYWELGVDEATADGTTIWIHLARGLGRGLVQIYDGIDLWRLDSEVHRPQRQSIRGCTTGQLGLGQIYARSPFSGVPTSSHRTGTRMWTEHARAAKRRTRISFGWCGYLRRRFRRVGEAKRQDFTWCHLGALPFSDHKRYGLLEGYIKDAGLDLSVDELNLDFLAEHVSLCGSPDTVIHKLEEMSREVGIGWGILCMNSHDAMDDPDPWFDSMRLFAQQVAPNVSLNITS